MTLSRHNENQFRDFPFRQRLQPIAGEPIVPQSWIVDLSLTLLNTGYGFLPSFWFLRRVSRVGNQITVTIASDLANPDTHATVDFVYTLNYSEFSSLRVWQGYVSSSWVGATLETNAVAFQQLQADSRYPVKYKVLPIETTSVGDFAQLQGYLTLGNPAAVTALLPADGEVLFSPTTGSLQELWELEPCQVTDLQAVNSVSFILSQRTDENVGPPNEDWADGVTPTRWDQANTYAKNPNGSPALVATTDENFVKQVPSFLYLSEGQLKWASRPAMAGGRIGSTLRTVHCDVVVDNVNNSIIFNAGSSRQQYVAPAHVQWPSWDASPARVLNSNEQLLAANRLADGNLPTVLPGIPCGQLIYTVNGLTGPDIPVTVGDGLIKSSTGDGHLRISVDLNHPKIRKFLNQ